MIPIMRHKAPSLLELRYAGNRPGGNFLLAEDFPRRHLSKVGVLKAAGRLDLYYEAETKMKYELTPVFVYEDHAYAGVSHKKERRTEKKLYKINPEGFPGLPEMEEGKRFQVMMFYVNTDIDYIHFRIGKSYNAHNGKVIEFSKILKPVLIWNGINYDRFLGQIKERGKEFTVNRFGYVLSDEQLRLSLVKVAVEALEKYANSNIPDKAEDYLLQAMIDYLTELGFLEVKGIYK